MERSTYGLRKGAWTEEEDLLLKQYVEKYGEQEKESGIKFFSEQVVEERERENKFSVLFFLFLFTLILAYESN